MKTKAGIFLVVFFSLVGISSCSSKNERAIRPPAVAGQFYPSDSATLDRTLSELFSLASPQGKYGTVTAIIVPHAGYIFSGTVAASAYSQIDPAAKFDNIFILGPSHHVAFDGAALYMKGDYATPLGIVEVNIGLERKLLEHAKIFTDRADAHAQEHSIEVQLPFLQHIFKNKFRIVPIVIGGDNPETSREIALALRPYFNSNNLFVISTDFSHYPSYKDAESVDSATGAAVCSNSTERLLNVIRQCERRRVPNLATTMCGLSCVMTLRSMTEHMPEIAYYEIAYRNSGDAGIAGRDQVVGYHAIVVSSGATSAGGTALFTGEEKSILLALAHQTLSHYLEKNKILPIDPDTLPASFGQKCGAFVTLKKDGQLRGCIGRFESSEPVWRVIQEMAIAAATEDPRFNPVDANELRSLTLELSILTPLKKITSIDEFTLGKHGIYIRKDGRSGTFLPQVAAETGWSKEEFLSHCSRDKAGLGWDGWKNADLFIYEAVVFGDDESVEH